MKPRSSFDWERVVWHGRDSACPVLCSYCCGGFRADGTALLVRRDDGDYRAVFCERCTEELVKEGFVEREGGG
jgi:hypothetical protein